VTFRGEFALTEQAAPVPIASVPPIDDVPMLTVCGPTPLNVSVWPAGIEKPAAVIATAPLAVTFAFAVSWPVVTLRPSQLRPVPSVTPAALLHTMLPWSVTVGSGENAWLTAPLKVVVRLAGVPMMLVAPAVWL